MTPKTKHGITIISAKVVDENLLKEEKAFKGHKKMVIKKSAKTKGAGTKIA